MNESPTLIHRRKLLSLVPGALGAVALGSLLESPAFALDPTDPVVTDEERAAFTAKAKRGWVEDGEYAGKKAGRSSRLRLPPAWAANIGMLDACLNVGMFELVNVTTSGSTTVTRANTAKLDSLLAPALEWNARPENKYKQIKVHIRIHTGFRCPDLWFDRCGSVMMGDVSWNLWERVPKWWTREYGRLYEQAFAALGPAFAVRNVIASVNSPMGAPFYPEPFLLFGEQMGEDGLTNGARLLRNNWNPSLQREAMVRDVKVPARHMKNKIVYLDINPTKWPSDAVSAVPFMWDLVDAHIASLPFGYAGIENYSMRDTMTWGDDSYDKMLDGMALRKKKAWLNVQLARPNRIAGNDGVWKVVWPKVSQFWLDLGGHSVETTGMSTKDGMVANLWPSAFEPRKDLMEKQDRAFALNPHP